jgi:hypothetical protein
MYYYFIDEKAIPVQIMGEKSKFQQLEFYEF